MTSLLQAEFWTRRDGTVVRVDEMDLGHLRNTVAMLERAAGPLEWGNRLGLLVALSIPMPSVIGEDEQGRPIYDHGERWQDSYPKGDMAVDMFERELEWREANPVEWLHSTPLVAAMDARIVALAT